MWPTGPEAMDELPILVLQEMLSFPQFAERPKCKLISKYWKFAFETAAGPQILCRYPDEFPPIVNWCFSEQNVVI